MTIESSVKIPKKYKMYHRNVTLIAIEVCPFWNRARNIIGHYWTS